MVVVLYKRDTSTKSTECAQEGKQNIHQEVPMQDGVCVSFLYGIDLRTILLIDHIRYIQIYLYFAIKSIQILKLYKFKSKMINKLSINMLSITQTLIVRSTLQIAEEIYILVRRIPKYLTTFYHFSVQKFCLAYLYFGGNCMGIVITSTQYKHWCNISFLNFYSACVCKYDCLNVCAQRSFNANYVYIGKLAPS